MKLDSNEYHDTNHHVIITAFPVWRMLIINSRRAKRPKGDNSLVERIYVATNAESSLRIVSKWIGAVGRS
jgi:hypothetical protein